MTSASRRSARAAWCAPATSRRATLAPAGPRRARQAPPFRNFFLDRYADAYRAEMDHFADVLAGAAPAVAYADGLAALALAEAAAQSARIGRPVQV